MAGILRKAYARMVLSGHEIRFFIILTGMNAAHACPYNILIHSEPKPKLTIKVMSVTARKTLNQVCSLRHSKTPQMYPATAALKVYPKKKEYPFIKAETISFKEEITIPHHGPTITLVKVDPKNPTPICAYSPNRMEGM